MHLLRIIFASLLLCVAVTRLDAQEGTTEYESHSGSELVLEVDRLRSLNQFSGTAKELAARRAVALLSDEAGSSLENDVIPKLAKISEPAIEDLSPEERKTLEAAIGNVEFDPGESEAGPLNPYYDWIHFQVTMMKESGAPSVQINERVAGWIEEVGVERLSVEMTRWCLEHVLPQMEQRNAFEVTWVGQITPPASGSYKFSTSPINVNKNLQGNEVVEHSISVQINGNEVLAAGPQNWDFEGDAVELDSSRAASIAVKVSYRSTDNRYGDSPHAMLYWEGPGITRTIVPSTVFQIPNGSENGLHATYSWTENSQPKEHTQTDSNLEFAWATCRNVAPHNSRLVDTLSDRLFEHCTDESYISSLLLPGNERPSHEHVYFRNYFGSEYLSCAQRGQFSTLLLENPDLILLANEIQLVRLYHSLRFGDTDKALDLVATWLQSKTLGEVQLGGNFFDANRRFYRTLALYLTVRTPGQAEHLQERYLELENGSCCVPVAYILGFAHLINNRIDEWVAFLDEKLSDEFLSGDTRATWLMARAQAAELRRSPGGREYQDEGQLLAGFDWLTEAQLVAEDISLQNRVVQEKVAQLVAIDQWDEADGILEGRSGMESWQSRIAELKTQSEDSAIARQAQIDNKYLNQLRSRKEKASARGATAEAERLEQLILEVSAATEAAN